MIGGFIGKVVGAPLRTELVVTDTVSVMRLPVDYVLADDVRHGLRRSPLGPLRVMKSIFRET